MVNQPTHFVSNCWSLSTSPSRILFRPTSDIFRDHALHTCRQLFAPAEARFCLFLGSAPFSLYCSTFRTFPETMHCTHVRQLCAPAEARFCLFLGPAPFSLYGIAHAKPLIEPTTTLSVCQHGEESVLVNVVVMFAQTFRAILVGGTKTVVGLAAQTDKSLSAPFYLEQSRRPLVEALACETTRLCGRPSSTGYSSADIVIFVFVATFGRKPLGSVSEVVRTTICPDESIDAFTSLRNVCRVCVHLAVLKQRSFYVSVYKVVVEL